MNAMIIPCTCTGRERHATKLVVLTGGPGGGKTAVLEIVRRAFCEHVAILPEAATILFGGGFPRARTAEGARATQRLVFGIQRELERAACEGGTFAVALCDRGTLDGLAYWPAGSPAELGIDRAAELHRYAAVIHLRPARAAAGYDRSNPARIETAEEALAVDARIEAAWDGHPKRFFVEAEGDFIAKVARAVALIRDEIPACCRAHRITELGE